MGKGSKPTIGYWYSMTLQFGLGYGPADALLEIRAADRVAWSGSQTASGDITINAPNLFGGEKKEGGIDGTFTLMMGEATQAPNARLVALRGTPQPAYRGLMTGVFDGKVAALNPYIKPWAFKARFLTAGWNTPVWESALCGIAFSGGMMINAAHFIYRLWVEVLGWDPATDIDLTRHQAAAQTLHDEGIGLCIKWSRSDGVNSTITTICNHIGAVVSEDPTTGKRFLKLIRDDYTVSALPVLDKTNIVELKDYQQAALHGSVNQVTGTYQDVTTNKPGSVTAQNLANQQAQGALVGKSIDYTMFPTADLTARAVERDCNAMSSLLATGQVRIKTPTAPILRGDVMLFNYTFGRWAVSMPVRILEVDDGSLTDATVTLKFAQDQFGVPATSYVAVQPSGWTAPALDPQAITDQVALEASYRDLATRLSTADLAALDATSGYLVTVAARPQSVAYNYTLLSQISGSGAAYAEVGAGDFAPSGTLHAAMPQEAGPSAVLLDNASGLDLVEVGSEALVDDELCRVDAIDPVAGTATLARGCVDTVPEAHAAGARVYFTDHYTGVDRTEYASGETINAKLLTRTGLGELAESLATAISVTLNERQARPYPPAGLLINSSAYPTDITGTFTVEWVERNRLTQGDKLIDTTTAGMTSETGTTYTIKVFIDGTLNATVTDAASGASVGPLSSDGSVKVEVIATHASLDSLQALNATFNYVVGSAVYATLNPSDKNSAIILSNGNLTASLGSNISNVSARATIGMSGTDKVYWESTATYSSGAESVECGIADASKSLSSYLGADSASVGGPFYGDGNCYFSGSIVYAAGTVASGAIVGHRYDAATGTYEITLDGSTWHTVKTGLSGTMYPAIDIARSTSQITLNFGQSAFTYAVPAGYSAGLFH